MKTPDITRLTRARIAAVGRMPRWAEIIRGSIRRSHLTCGKPLCRCHQSPQKRHGPYWYVSVPVGKGRNKSYLLTAAQVPAFKKARAAYQKLWKELCVIGDLNLALLRAGAWRLSESKRTRK